MNDDDRCYKCDKPAESEAGTIFVRRMIDGRMRSVPICDDCWEIENPGRTPYRVRRSVL